MYFARYEIRTTWKRCFYEGGDNWDYLPFDTLEEAREYIKTHSQEMKATNGEEITLCKVYLYSNYDRAEIISIFDSNGKEWTPEKFNILGVLEYIANKPDLSQEQKKADIYEIAKQKGLIRECKKRGWL